MPNNPYKLTLQVDEEIVTKAKAQNINISELVRFYLSFLTTDMPTDGRERTAKSYMEFFDYVSRIFGKHDFRIDIGMRQGRDKKGKHLGTQVWLVKNGVFSKSFTENKVERLGEQDIAEIMRYNGMKTPSEIIGYLASAIEVNIEYFANMSRIADKSAKLMKNFAELLQEQEEMLESAIDKGGEQESD